MAATADQTLWAFIMYVKNNPFKSMDAMTENDFDAMVKQFVAVNKTQATGNLTEATALDWPNHYGYGAVSYGDLDFPKRDGTTARWAADGTGIACSTTYALNMTAVKQASYPEEPANQLGA